MSTPTPDTCPLCRVLGAELHVDFDEGQTLPPEARQLVRRHDDPTYPVEQCPLCHTWYEACWTEDNDVIQPTHTVTLRRVPEDYALDAIRAALAAREKHERWRRQLGARRRRTFRRRVEKRLRAAPALSAQEQKLLDLLVDEEGQEGHEGFTLQHLQARLGWSADAVRRVVGSLGEKQIVWTGPERGDETLVYVRTS